jgi:hypothetical protein
LIASCGVWGGGVGASGKTGRCVFVCKGEGAVRKETIFGRERAEQAVRGSLGWGE